ncbi:phage polarity suppression protein [Escherichia coli]
MRLLLRRRQKRQSPGRITQYYRSQKMAGESGRWSLSRSHEAVQHISIRDRLNDFMQQHGTALAAALAPELMGYSELTAIARKLHASSRRCPCVKPFCPGLRKVKN